MTSDKLTDELVEDSELQMLIDSHEKGTAMFMRVDSYYLMAKELQEHRTAVEDKDLLGVIDALEHPAGINAAGKQVVRRALAELQERRKADNAEPVFFIEVEGDDWIQAGRIPGSTFDFNNLPDGINKLYAVPQPAPDSEAQATLKRLAVILHGSEVDLNLLTVTAQSLMDRCKAGNSPVTTE
ncbi:hypothetical protein OGY34_19865 [Citrobacter sp. Cy232]|uniref:hypothetical protein n=1 Tax=unclassified Citrobacter TaxID=2644389 RepID=UPI001908F4FF|nr:MULTISPECIES: hypothetical protein [unclassified Citrobacter]MBJ9883204.1 hypothetical protein [Citrobacter sp. FDAARGOS_156]MDM2718703.1 hypothetical protein [Citrobacter sp. Cy232]